MRVTAASKRHRPSLPTKLGLRDLAQVKPYGLGWASSGIRTISHCCV